MHLTLKCASFLRIFVRLDLLTGSVYNRLTREQLVAAIDFFLFYNIHIQANALIQNVNI